MTGSQERAAVALALLAGPPVAVDWLPVSPVPHPVKNGMTKRRRPVTMVVRCNGLRVVSVTLVRGKQFCCVVRSFMCCSDLAMAYDLRGAGHKIDTIEG